MLTPGINKTRYSGKINTHQSVQLNSLNVHDRFSWPRKEINLVLGGQGFPSRDAWLWCWMTLYYISL